MANYTRRRAEDDLAEVRPTLLNKAKYGAFCNKCKAENVLIRDVLEELMRLWVAGEITLDLQ